MFNIKDIFGTDSYNLYRTNVSYGCYETQFNEGIKLYSIGEYTAFLNVFFLAFTIHPS